MRWGRELVGLTLVSALCGTVTWALGESLGPWGAILLGLPLSFGLGVGGALLRLWWLGRV